MDKLIEKITNKLEFAQANESEIRPVFFRLKDEADYIKFSELLESNLSIEIHDTYKQQLEELFKIRKFQTSLFTTEAKKNNELNSDDFLKEGVWVYYPWLNKIVHLLGEDDFIEVRTNRNQHKITKNERNVLLQKKIGIVGLSVGQSIAMTIVLERCCGEIRLADFDSLELSNLNRIKTGLYNLGLKKIVQAAREIAELDPYIKVVCYSDGLTEDNIDDFLTKNGKIDLLIEECDSLDIKILSRLKAKQYAVPVLMETNDRGMVDIERYDLDKDYPLLHNLIGEISWKELGNLTTEQKLPMMMKLTNFKNITPRQKLTVLELGQSISTWPQLASNVILGAGVTTDVARRILLNHLKTSGRFYVDVENIIKDNEAIAPAYVPPALKEMATSDMRFSVDEILKKKNKHGIAVPKDIIEKIVTDAGKAPSSGNDQPWRFFCFESKLFLFHEQARSYSFGDYKNMASYISLGAVIENLVLSAHNHGIEVETDLFPQDDNYVCVAMFTFHKNFNGNLEDHTYDYLYQYIDKRITNRKITSTEQSAASQDVLQELKSAAESFENTKASFVSDRASFLKLGNIISAGDRIRIMHPQGNYDFFHREIRATAEETNKLRTGMDIATLELSQQANFALGLVSDETIMTVLRDIDGLKALKHTSVPNALNSAAIGFLETSQFTPLDFILGGRAMQRQWLKATELGFAYHPMVVPLYLFYRLVFGNGEGLSNEAKDEVTILRKQFLEIFPGDEKRGEIILFRIFKADEPKVRSPRLNLDEILILE